MRIERLDIEGFGHFAGQSVGPFGQPLTVVLGPNEAGKSTLLAFIRTMLFGFPTRLRADVYPPLSGGRHGGRITLAGDDGVTYVVERFEDKRGVSLKIASSERLQTNDESVLRSLLGHSSQNVFESVFALGLLDLQDIERLNKSDASAQIYAAGMGAANLPKVNKSIEDAQSKLFLPSGSRQEAAQIVGRLREVETAIEKTRGDSARFAALNSRRTELERQIEQSTERLKEGTVALDEVTRLRQSWDDWVTLGDAEARLRDLPERKSFPDDAIARLEQAADSLQQAIEARDEAVDKVELGMKRASATIPCEALLGERERINQIRRGRGAFDASVADLPKRQAELSAQERVLQGALAELGPDWTEGRVTAFDASIRVRDSLEQQRKRLEDAEIAMRNAIQIRDHADEVARDAADVAERRRLALEATPLPTSDGDACKAQRAAVNLAQIRLVEYQRAVDQRANAEALASQAGAVAAPGQVARQSYLPAMLFAASGVVASAVGIALGGNALVLGLLLGLVLVGAGVALAFLARHIQHMAAAPVPGVTSDAYLDQLRAAEQEGLGALLQAARPIATAVPTLADLQRISQAIDAAERSIQARADAQRTFDEAHIEQQRAIQRADAAARTMQGAEQERDAAVRNWREWLASEGLSQTFLPATVIALVARIDTVRAMITAANDLRHRIEAIERDIETFSGLIGALALELAIPRNPSQPAAIAAAADRLIQDFETAERAATLREEAQRALEEARQEGERLESRVSERRKGLADLLAGGHASDAEQFRLNARSHADRQRALQEKSDAEARLRRLSGPGEPYQQLVEALANTNASELEQEHERLSQERSIEDEWRGQLQTEFGGVETELKQLDSDEQASRLRAERAVLVEQLHETARRWASLSVARALLDRAQRKFEEERQPDVLHHAQRFFATVTGGRYDRLVSPLGSQSITVMSPDGSGKAASQLSQGTQDQLYLALRFGLIRAFALRSAPLPVIVDEILVNFDPERALRAAQAFAELAETNQVLVFTCHPETVELFRGTSQAVQVINLPDATHRAPAPVRS